MRSQTTNRKELCCGYVQQRGDHKAVRKMRAVNKQRELSQNIHQKYVRLTNGIACNRSVIQQEEDPWNFIIICKFK